jgi:hypothetical protein
VLHWIASRCARPTRNRPPLIVGFAAMGDASRSLFESGTVDMLTVTKCVRIGSRLCFKTVRNWGTCLVRHKKQYSGHPHMGIAHARMARFTSSNCLSIAQRGNDAVLVPVSYGISNVRWCVSIGRSYEHDD